MQNIMQEWKQATEMIARAGGLDALVARETGADELAAAVARAVKAGAFANWPVDDEGSTLLTLVAKFVWAPPHKQRATGAQMVAAVEKLRAAAPELSIFATDPGALLALVIEGWPALLTAVLEGDDISAHLSAAQRAHYARKHGTALLVEASQTLPWGFTVLKLTQALPGALSLDAVDNDGRSALHHVALRCKHLAPTEVAAVRALLQLPGAQAWLDTPDGGGMVPRSRIEDALARHADFEKWVERNKRLLTSGWPGMVALRRAFAGVDRFLVRLEHPAVWAAVVAAAAVTYAAGAMLCE